MEKEPEMFGEIIKDIANKKTATLKELKKLPFECDKISLAEMEQLRAVNAFLSSAIEKYEKESKSLELIFGKDGQKNTESYKKAKKDIEQKRISNIMTDLDSLKVWSHKFSSESQGTGENLTKTPDDSLYYMSHSGASLRFKMANKGKGLKKIIQPIMEKIFFERVRKGKIEILETPKLGYTVCEYATQDFFDQLEKDSVDSDYKSQIRKYKRGDKIEIPKLENIKYDHEGSPVNKIYFEK